MARSGFDYRTTLLFGGSQPGIWLTGYRGEDERKKGKRSGPMADGVVIGIGVGSQP
jgi:hypothetical protein